MFTSAIKITQTVPHFPGENPNFLSGRTLKKKKEKKNFKHTGRYREQPSALKVCHFVIPHKVEHYKI